MNHSVKVGGRIKERLKTISTSSRSSFKIPISTGKPVIKLNEMHKYENHVDVKTE